MTAEGQTWTPAFSAQEAPQARELGSALYRAGYFPILAGAQCVFILPFLFTEICHISLLENVFLSWYSANSISICFLKRLPFSFPLFLLPLFHCLFRSAARSSPRSSLLGLSISALPWKRSFFCARTKDCQPCPCSRSFAPPLPTQGSSLSLESVEIPAAF